jgi:hypothetical protein
VAIIPSVHGQRRAKVLAVLVGIASRAALTRVIFPTFIYPHLCRMIKASLRLGILCVALAYAIQANAQQAITIEAADMPQVNDTFRYSICDNILGLIDLGDDGPDRFWDYSTLGSLNQRLDTVVDPVFGTPLIYNVTFSNFFDFDHFATHAARNSLGQFSQSFLTIENVFDFYKKTNGFYANVGLGLTINGFPLTSVMEPRDKVWEFPLEYGDVDNCFAQFGVDVPQFGHFGQKIERQNTVDGWGTIKTRFGTFDALRVTTILELTDTLSIQGFGFEQPRPTEFEIKWMAKNIGVPVLTVRGQILFGTKVVSSVEYLDSLRGFTLSTPLPEPVDTTQVDTTIIDSTGLGMLDDVLFGQMLVSPNPFADELMMHLQLARPATLRAELYGIMGQRVAYLGRRTFAAGQHNWGISIEGMSLPAGIYHLVLTDDDGHRMVRKLMRGGAR